MFPLKPRLMTEEEDGKEVDPRQGGTEPGERSPTHVCKGDRRQQAFLEAVEEDTHFQP